jgi:hypothetical protein
MRIQGVSATSGSVQRGQAKVRALRQMLTERTGVVRSLVDLDTSYSKVIAGLFICLSTKQFPASGE